MSTLSRACSATSASHARRITVEEALSENDSRGARRAARSDAVRWGLVARNAAALSYAPRVVKQELQVLGPQDANDFLATLEGHRLAGFFTTLLASGLRLGEALGLQWGDLDLEKGTLRVRRALQRVGKKLEFVEPKSRRSTRVVSLPAFAIVAIKKHQACQAAERRLAGSRWVESSLRHKKSNSPLHPVREKRVIKPGFATLSMKSGNTTHGWSAKTLPSCTPA